MDQERPPSNQMLAQLNRAGRRRPGQSRDDEALGWESVDELRRARELLKLAPIEFFLVKVWLVQVGLQFGHRGQKEECDQRQKAECAVYLENQRYHFTPSLSSRMPNR